MALSREEINNAFTDAIALDFAEDLNNEENINHIFSERHIKKMQRLIKAQRKPYYFLINTTLKKVAIIFIALAIVFTAAITLKEDDYEIVKNETWLSTPDEWLSTPDDDYKDYISHSEAGLLEHINLWEVIEEEKKGTVKTFFIGEKEYTATYSNSMILKKEGEEYTRKLDSEIYAIKDVVSYEVFKSNGKLCELIIEDKELEKAEPYTEDFSEEGLKAAAVKLLTELYGEEIKEYLGTYYIYEEEDFVLGGREIHWRAYINGVATNDVISVYFDSKGAVKRVEANRYLMFYNYDTDKLIKISKLEKIMKKYLKKHDLKDVGIEDTPIYMMNDKGDIYYNVEWQCRDRKNENALKMILCELAIKANK